MEWEVLERLSEVERKGWPFAYIPADAVIDEEENRPKTNKDGSIRLSPAKRPSRDRGLYGADLDAMTLEALSWELIPRGLIEREMDTLHKRWFDYRMMHPARATMELSKHWRHAVMHYNVKFLGEGGFGFKGEHCFLTKTPGMTAKYFWQIRQMADRAGVQYRFFANTIIELACQTKYLTARVPSVATILKRDDLISTTIDAWYKWCDARLIFPENPFYKAENWRGHPDQKSFQIWLVRELKHRNAAALARALYQEKYLLPQVAERFFDQSKIAQARDEFFSDE